MADNRGGRREGSGRKSGIPNKKTVDPFYKEKKEVDNMLLAEYPELMRTAIALAKGIKMVKVMEDGEEEVYTAKPDKTILTRLLDGAGGKPTIRTETHHTGGFQMQVVAAQPKKERKPKLTIEPQKALPEAVLEGEFTDVTESEEE